jgi:dihydroneopterin aldolase
MMVCRAMPDKPKDFKLERKVGRLTLGAISLSFGDYENRRYKFSKNLSKSKVLELRNDSTETASRMRVSAEQQVHIEQLKVFARVGVSQAERSKRQRLVLNITLWPARDLRDIKDSIQRTVDYSDLCQKTRDFISEQSPKLLETLASDLTSHLLRKFRIRKISLEIRKFVLKDAAYASVTVTRHASLD